MKLKILAAVIAALLAGCGGGGDDNNSTTTTPAASGSSGTSSTGASGTADTSTTGSTSTATGTGATTGTGTTATGTSATGATGTGSTTGTGPSATGSSGSTPAAGAGTSAGAPAPVSSAGSQYLSETAAAGQIEAQQSQQVATKSPDPAVQALAQQTALEINIVNQQITQIAQTNNVTLNTTVTTQQQDQLNALNALSGAELNRTYVKNLVDSWRALLASTLTQARQGTDVQVRQAAVANLLTFEQRLATAQQLLVVLQPTEWLVDAYEDGLLEIQLGQLALQKATSPEVKAFAQRMIDDHTQMGTDITALAKAKNVTLPTSLAPEQQQIVTAISSFTGADFDKAYMDRNVLTHAEDVSKTSVVSQRSTDAEIKALAADSLPILQDHLQSAQSIAASLQGSAFYQLAQNLINEIQIAQLARVRGANTQQLTALAQQIITEDQATFAQLLQLAQLRNLPIPLTIRPAQVQPVLQLAGATGTTANSQLLALITEQNSQSLQTVQAAQTSTDAAITAFAQARLTVLQARATQLAQLASGTTASSGATGTSGTGTATGTTGSGTTGTGTTGTGTTGTGTTGTGTTGTGTTGTSTTGTSTTGTTSDTGAASGTSSTGAAGAAGTTGAGTTGANGTTGATATTGTTGTTGGSTGTGTTTGTTGTTDTGTGTSTGTTTGTTGTGTSTGTTGTGTSTGTTGTDTTATPTAGRA